MHQGQLEELPSWVRTCILFFSLNYYIKEKIFNGALQFEIVYQLQIRFLNRSKFECLRDVKKKETSAAIELKSPFSIQLLYIKGVIINTSHRRKSKLFSGVFNKKAITYVLLETLLKEKGHLSFKIQASQYWLAALPLEEE